MRGKNLAAVWALSLVAALVSDVHAQETGSEGEGSSDTSPEDGRDDGPPLPTELDEVEDDEDDTSTEEPTEESPEPEEQGQRPQPPVTSPEETPAEGNEGGADEAGFFDGLAETDEAFRITRGRTSLGIQGSVRLLAVPFIDDPMASIESGSIANAEGFRLRAIRFGVAGDLPHSFGFGLLFQYAGDGVDILDAVVSFAPHPLARVRVGVFKVPFSGSMMLSSEYQSFLERPYIVRSVAPDRELGVALSGSMHFLSYHFGIFNGGGDFFGGDNNPGMRYMGRFELHPLGQLPDGEITQPERPVFRLAAAYSFNQDATGNRHSAMGELAFRWTRLTIRGEFLWSLFDPASVPLTDEDVEYGSTQQLGWFAEAGVFIVNEHLAVALRYEGQFVTEAVEIRDLNDLWAIGGAVHGYFLQGRIKLSLAYEHRHEWFDEQVRNDYVGIQVQGRI